MLVSGPNVRIGKEVWEATMEMIADEARNALEGVIRVNLAHMGTSGGRIGQHSRHDVSNESDRKQFAEWLGVEVGEGWDADNKLMKAVLRRLLKKIRK